MKWLYKLDYKYGKYYIPRLMLIIVIGMAAVFLLGTAGLPVSQYLSLTREALFSGQVWRLVTFLFIPESTSIFWVLFLLYFYYSIGTSLEQIWGGFRFNFYYFTGAIGAIIACLITGTGTNYYLNLSLFLAFATLMPDTEFRLFFILPIKAKYLALVDVAFLVYGVASAFGFGGVQYGLASLAALAVSLIHYLIFFWHDFTTMIRDEIAMQKRRATWRRNQ